MATRKSQRIGLFNLTIPALQRIADHILANPEQYDQNHFVRGFNSESEIGCIAFHHAKLHRTSQQLKNLAKKEAAMGWTADWVPSKNPFYIAAKKDLKLTDEQARLLLSSTLRWPLKFHTRYKDSKTPKGRARAAHDFIEFFISTNGTGLTDRERRANEKKALNDDTTTTSTMRTNASN